MKTGCQQQQCRHAQNARYSPTEILEPARPVEAAPVNQRHRLHPVLMLSP
ncbi:hypothetical protein GbCGDNIH7_8332 [Granulibacter bethesdensis]|nr:hypothetical protein GbCGDNIH7_8332 [Granulibacter bethesdensis]